MNTELTGPAGAVWWTHGPWYRYSGDWAIPGLRLIARDVGRKTGALIMDGEDVLGVHTITSGAAWVEPFEDAVFALRNPCTCWGGLPWHEESCPPCFEHFGTGLKITWRSHVADTITSTHSYEQVDWGWIVEQCRTATENSQ